MERAEAEAIYEQGRDAVVEVLLALSAQNERLETQVAQLTVKVARQEERIAQLERNAKRSSRNSSQPPSEDPPGSPPRRGKDPSGRSQGAQPGHEGKGRELLPTSAVDEVIVHWPTRCACGHVFGVGELAAVGEPVRHQVEELPRLAVTVTEHQCPRVCCPGCRRRARASLPADVAASAFGPRFHAAVAVLSVRNRVSRRDVVELCEQLFGARVASGTIDAILERTADALVEPDTDLLERVRASKTLNVDETGWRTAGQRRALWGAFTDRHAVLRVREDRHEDHARQLLADTGAIVTSDRWWAYSHLPVKRRQICWAHLRRDFKAHAEGLGAEKAFGEASLKVCEELFWTLGDLPAHPRPHRAQASHPRAALRVQADPADLLGQGATLQVLPRDRTQPPEGLARAVDVRRPQGRAADQQPRRTRAARIGHLPQAQPRHPVPAGRTPYRTTPLSPHHLPPATPAAARLPRRRPHGRQPRRPGPAARLTRSDQLNAYRVGAGSMVAAGSVVPENRHIAAGMLAAGVPATEKKAIAGASKEWIESAAAEYHALRDRYLNGA